MKNRYLQIAIFALLMFIPFLLDAQCPMCRATLESNMKNGGTAGNGMNNGIMYMFAMPYLAVGTLGYLWWRNRKKESEIDAKLDINDQQAQWN